MALIIKCRKCRARIAQEATACPACGSTSLRQIVDYWPKGRAGGRRQITLPEGITREAAGKIERGMRGAKRKAPDVSASTVAGLFPEYLGWCAQHKAKTTRASISRLWDLHFERILGKCGVSEIEAAHYSLYQKARGPYVGNATINTELNYFSGFLSWCRREKKLQIPKVQYEKLPSSRPLPIVLSPDEVIRILAAAEQEPLYHALILCLYSLGLRISEARGLKVEDFDFANRTVRTLQKGGTEKILPIDEMLEGSVKKLIELRGIKAGEYIFSFRDGKPFTRVPRAFARICRRAGVTKKVYPHLFRHTASCHLMESNVNMSIIQKFLGHANIATVQWYAHVSMSNLRAAQSSLTQPPSKAQAQVDLYRKAP